MSQQPTPQALPEIIWIEDYALRYLLNSGALQLDRHEFDVDAEPRKYIREDLAPQHQPALQSTDNLPTTSGDYLWQSRVSDSWRPHKFDAENIDEHSTLRELFCKWQTVPPPTPLPIGKLWKEVDASKELAKRAVEAAEAWVDADPEYEAALSNVPGFIAGFMAASTPISEGAPVQDLVERMRPAMNAGFPFDSEVDDFDNEKALKACAIIATQYASSQTAELREKLAAVEAERDALKRDVVSLGNDLAAMQSGGNVRGIYIDKL